jgi:Flp pilus assembly protein TadD
MNLSELKNKWQFWAVLGGLATLIAWALITEFGTSDDKALSNAKNAYIQGNLTAAQKQYETIIQSSNKNNPEAWNNLGNIYRDQKKWADAERVYLEAIRLNPKYDQAYRNIAFIYIDWAEDSSNQSTELLNKGVALLESAFSKNTKSISIAEDLVNLYRKLGNTAKADYYLKIRNELLAE